MRFKVNVANHGHNFEARLARLKAEEYQNGVKHRQHEMANSENNTEVAC
jgi:hypothetical protein